MSDHSHRLAPGSSRTIVSALVLLAAAFASADHNWHLDSVYDFTLTTTSSLHDVEKVMDVKGVANDYSLIDTGSTIPESQGRIDFAFDTYSQYLYSNPHQEQYRNASEPQVTGSLLFGVLTDPTDPAVDHLALFTNPVAAGLLEGRNYEDVFDTSVYSEQDVIDAILYVHQDPSVASDEEKLPYYDVINAFRFDYAFRANVGDADGDGSDDPMSLYFAPGDFGIVAFSSGLGVGGGINTTQTTFTPVPEPASLAALGLGAVGLLRRRRRLEK